jgi:REP element-mobilizing transposase RayT
MARPLRLEIPDGAYHVWNRGVNRADIVFDDRDRQRFVDLLQEVVRRFGWIVHQFMLMTNHFHLVLSTPDPTLSRGMKRLEHMGPLTVRSSISCRYWAARGQKSLAFSEFAADRADRIATSET